ncbi:MAG: SDR family NAD(P)-dependent oxidoreductase [Candidatus Lokiarchaeota archaeon]|nr:SDR family NAD(P)-dependent oxidoreductase [Candidatus Lokiarchaeota archaeon]
MANKKMIEKKPCKGKFALIVGGSQGIGKEIAKEIIRLSGNVCILARTVKTLEEAVEEISNEKVNDNQLVEMISCDATDMDKLKNGIDSFIKNHGIPYYLINCVGQAYPNYLENMKIEDFKKSMDINYIGTVAPILSILPHMIEKSKKIQEETGINEWNKDYYGHIINLSSEAGFLGLMGYSTYCPTKFAIVGLSECLRHELKPYHIRVSVVFPVDTQTPGFEFENKIKPDELKMISARAGLMEADEVAEKIMKKVLNNKFKIFLGAAGFHNWAKRHMPWLAYSELDGDLKKARKKLGKNTYY